jgi:hypothetical protein
MPVIVHYPEHPIADAQLGAPTAPPLREVVAAARAAGVPFRLIYPASRSFRYHSDGRRTSR